MNELGTLTSPPQPKKGRNVRFLMSVMALLLVLISGGVYFYGKSKDHISASPMSDTNTASAKQSTEAVRLTPQALFFDNFADNSAGWTVGDVAGFSRTISNHMLTITETNAKQFLPENLPINGSFSNSLSAFSITVTATFKQADANDSLGLYLRGDTNLAHDYRLDIYGNNTFAIVKEYLDENNVPQQYFLIAATESNALKPIGQPNTFTVIMKGSKLVLFINGALVSSTTDSDYSSGQIALFVFHDEISSTVVVAFTQVAVYPAPDKML